MTANEKRLAVRNAYREIIGRNFYSQSLRNYCYVKFSDGKYYSDCSSSISHAYKKAGFGFGILNTVGMYGNKDFQKVAVTIKGGIIQNPAQLRIGDMLLFAGKDSSRKASGYVGHVEMVGEISGDKITLYGHGSGNPSKKELNEYCKKRFAMKSGTALGHCGLIRVMRFIRDDEPEKDKTKPEGNLKVKAGSWNIRSGPGTVYGIIGQVTGGEKLQEVDGDGWHVVRVNDSVVGFISDNAVERS